MDIKNFASGIGNGGSGAADLIAVWSSASVINAYSNFAFDGTTFKLPLDMRMNEAGTAAVQAVIRNRANTGSVVMWGASIDDGGTVEVFGHSHATKPAWTEIGSNGTAYLTVKPGSVIECAAKITVSHGSGDSIAISKPGTQGPSLFFNSTNGTTATNDWRLDIDQSSTSFRVLNSSSAVIVNVSQAGKVTIGAPNGAQLHDVNGRGWNVVYGTGGVTAYVQITHSSNTANSGAAFYASVAGGSAFDPWIGFNVAGSTDWAVGIDNSDSDSFKICKSSALGTNDYLVITTAGAVSVSSTFLASGLYSRNGVLQLNNAATAALNSIISLGAADGYLSLSGDTSGSSGANIELYGSTHGSAPSEIRFRQGTTVVGNIGASALWTIGTGTSTTHKLNTQLATAASDALTLGNGPAGKAGNPAVYIQINVNGTNRVIPAW